MEEKEISELYDGQSLDIMRTAEEALDKGLDRVTEITNYARMAGIKRIGIANCISFQKEAEIVKQFLSDEFEVYAIDCKCGRIEKHELFGGDSKAIACNPVGQAEFLKNSNTELNISMGLCVGHDMIFNCKSAVPVTGLIIKDRKSKNPIESIRNIAQATDTKPG